MLFDLANLFDIFLLVFFFRTFHIVVLTNACAMA